MEESAKTGYEERSEKIFIIYKVRIRTDGFQIYLRIKFIVLVLKIISEIQPKVDHKKRPIYKNP